MSQESVTFNGVRDTKTMDEKNNNSPIRIISCIDYYKNNSKKIYYLLRDRKEYTQETNEHLSFLIFHYILFYGNTIFKRLYLTQYNCKKNVGIG